MNPLKPNILITNNDNPTETFIEEQSPENVDSYAKHLTDRLKTTHQITLKALKETQDKARALFQKKQLTIFSTGGLVLLKIIPLLKGNNKFKNRYSGPHIVIQKLTDVNYKIKNTLNNKVDTVHYDRLKPYYPQDSNLQTGLVSQDCDLNDSTTHPSGSEENNDQDNEIMITLRSQPIQQNINIRRSQRQRIPNSRYRDFILT